MIDIIKVMIENIIKVMIDIIKVMIKNHQGDD